MGYFKRSVVASAIFSANLLSVTGISASAFGAEATDEQNTQGASTLGTVIVTGTRAQERTASASLSPIDVISGDSLRSSGSSELGTVLARLIPSINFPGRAWWTVRS